MKKIFLILPLLILFSCSVQKRKYQKGFYVSTGKTKHQTKKDGIVSKKQIVSEGLVSLPATLPSEDNTFAEATAETKLNPVKIKKTSLIIDGTDTCDVITLKNGDDVRGHVLEITPIDIKYKKCDLPDGPLYIVKKTDVFMIRYSNGTKEVIKEEASNPNLSNRDQRNTNTTPSNPSPLYNGPKKVHPLAIVAIVCAVLGFFTYGIGFLLGSIFANMAIKRIRAQPERYKGELLAKIARMIGIIVLGIIVFILLLALLAGGI